MMFTYPTCNIPWYSGTEMKKKAHENTAYNEKMMVVKEEREMKRLFFDKV